MIQPQIIRKIEQVECPHCKKMMYASYQTMLPAITNVSSLEQIEEAKSEIKERLEQIKFKDSKEKNSIIEWLDKDETLLDKSDIESIINQISREQLEKISKKNE